jgi:hypothetical protein
MLRWLARLLALFDEALDWVDDPAVDGLEAR